MLSDRNKRRVIVDTEVFNLTQDYNRTWNYTAVKTYPTAQGYF